MEKKKLLQKLSIIFAAVALLLTVFVVIAGIAALPAERQPGGWNISQSMLFAVLLIPTLIADGILSLASVLMGLLLLFEAPTAKEKSAYLGILLPDTLFLANVVFWALSLILL